MYQITVDYNVQRNANGEEIPKFAQSYTWTKNYGLVFLDAKNCLRGAGSFEFFASSIERFYWYSSLESPYRIVGFNRNEIIGPCPAPPYKKSQGNEIEGLIADGGEDLFAPASTLDFDSYLGSGTLSTPNENLDLTSPLIADSTVFGNFLPGPGDAGTTNEEFSIFNTAENPENLSPFSNAAVNDDMFSGTDPLNIGYEPLAKRGSGKQGRQREHNWKVAGLTHACAWITEISGEKAWIERIVGKIPRGEGGAVTERVQIHRSSI